MLAHQGGWDEALLVLAPVLLLAGLVWVASVRHRDRLGTDAAGDQRPEAR